MKLAEADCFAANVEENDHTVFTCQDLEFELELVIHSVAKKIAFIDNQVSSPLTLVLFSLADMSNIRLFQETTPT